MGLRRFISFAYGLADLSVNICVAFNLRTSEGTMHGGW